MVDVGVALYMGYIIATAFLFLGVITMILLKLNLAFRYFKSAIIILILVSSAGSIMEYFGYSPDTVNLTDSVMVSIPSGAYVKTGTLYTELGIYVLLPERAHWTYQIRIYVDGSEINYNKYVINTWALSGSSDKAFDWIRLQLGSNFFEDFHEKTAEITMTVTVDGNTKTFSATGTIYDPDKMRTSSGGLLSKIANAILDVIYGMADALKFLWGGIGEFLGETFYYLFLSPMPDWYINPTTGDSYFYEIYYNTMMPLFFFLLPIMLILGIVYRSMMLSENPISETFHDGIIAFLYATSGYFIYEYSAYILNYISIKLVEIGSMGTAISGALSISILGILISYIVPGAGFFFATILLGIFMLYAIAYLRFVLIASLLFLIPIVSAFYILPPLKGLASRVGSLLANLMFGGVIFAVITRALTIVLPQSWYGKTAYLLILPFIYIFAVPTLLQMLGFAGGTVFAGGRLLGGIRQGLIPFAVGTGVGMALRGQQGGSTQTTVVTQPVSTMTPTTTTAQPTSPTTPVGQSQVQLTTPMTYTGGAQPSMTSTTPTAGTTVSAGVVTAPTPSKQPMTFRERIVYSISHHPFVERLKVDYSRYAPKTMPFQDLRKMYRPELSQPKEVTEALGGKSLVAMVKENPQFRHDLDLYSRLPENDVRRQLIAERYGMSTEQLDRVSKWYSENRDKFSSVVVGTATKSDFNVVTGRVGKSGKVREWENPTLVAYASLTEKEKQALAQYFDLKRKVARGEASSEALESIRKSEPFISGWNKMKAGAITGVKPKERQELLSNPERLEERISGAFSYYHGLERQGKLSFKPLVNEKESVLSRVRASPIVRDAKAVAKYTGGLVAKGVVATGVLTKNVAQSTAQRVRQNAPAFLYYTAVGLSGHKAKQVFAHYGVKPPHAEFRSETGLINEHFDEEIWEYYFLQRENEGL